MSIDVTEELNLERLEALTAVVAERRSVRSFEPGRRVSREVLEGIMEAARWAPSGANSQPWELCVVDDPDTIVAVAAVMSDQADRLNEHCKGFPHVHKKHWVHDAIAIAAVFVDPRWTVSYPVATEAAMDRDEYAENRDNILLVSVGAAVQNLQLATCAAGLTSAWLSGGGEPQTARELRELLGFEESHVPYAVVPIGWPHRRSESRWRRPLAEVIHWNGVNPDLLRDGDDIDRYIEQERRNSIYRDAETRQAMLEGSAVDERGLDPVDDGRAP